jgi:hypothetical protein
MKIKLTRNTFLDGMAYKKDDIVETSDDNANALIRMGKAIPSDSQDKSVGLKSSKPKKKLEIKKDEESESSSSDSYLG